MKEHKISDKQIQMALKTLTDNAHDSDIMKLAVLVPSLEYWKADFSVSLFSLAMKYAMSKVDLPWIKHQSIVLFNRKSSVIHSSRHQLVCDALEWGATHILFADCDQTFPPDLIHRLMAHKQMVVGANIVTKQIPAVFCATGLDGKRVKTLAASSGLEEVRVCGTGVMLIDTRVFAKLSIPYFLMPYNPDTRTFLGEDVYFSGILREAGFKIYIDHDVSKEVGHIGQLEYTYAHSGEIDAETGEANFFAIPELMKEETPDGSV